jgi:hypothetical protein
MQIKNLLREKSMCKNVPLVTSIDKFGAVVLCVGENRDIIKLTRVQVQLLNRAFQLGEIIELETLSIRVNGTRMLMNGPEWRHQFKSKQFNDIKRQLLTHYGMPKPVQDSLSFGKNQFVEMSRRSFQSRNRVAHR